MRASQEPTAIRPVDGIPESISVFVHPSRDPDRIRGEEGTELGIEVSGMEVYASVFGVRARETRIARIVRQDDRATFS
jgi:hypothetical protein